MFGVGGSGVGLGDADSYELQLRFAKENLDRRRKSEAENELRVKASERIASRRRSRSNNSQGYASSAASLPGPSEEHIAAMAAAQVAASQTMPLSPRGSFRGVTPTLSLQPSESEMAIPLHPSAVLDDKELARVEADAAAAEQAAATTSSSPDAAAAALAQQTKSMRRSFTLPELSDNVAPRPDGASPDGLDDDSAGAAGADDDDGTGASGRRRSIKDTDPKFRATAPAPFGRANTLHDFSPKAGQSKTQPIPDVVASPRMSSMRLRLRKARKTDSVTKAQDAWLNPRFDFKEYSRIVPGDPENPKPPPQSAGALPPTLMGALGRRPTIPSIEIPSKSNQAAVDRLRLLNQYDARQKKITDVACFLAGYGALATVIDLEYYHANGRTTTDFNFVLRCTISASTLLLQYCLFVYYATKWELFRFKNSLSDDFRIWSTKFVLLFLAEAAVCLIHLPPGLDFFYRTEHKLSVSVFSSDMLGLFVLARMYLILRYLRFHTWLSGPGARFIGLLNGVEITSEFALRGALYHNAGLVLLFTVVVLVTAGSYAVCVCERTEQVIFDHYPSGVWFLLVTMSSVGYGDLAPITDCGRFFAVMGSVSGIILTSLVFAVFTRMLVFSKPEMRVIQFLEKDFARRTLRQLSARAIQAGWRTHVARRRGRFAEEARWRRRLVEVLRQFKGCRNGLRHAFENENIIGLMVENLFNETHDVQLLMADYFEEIVDRLDSVATGLGLPPDMPPSGPFNAAPRTNPASNSDVVERLDSLEQQIAKLTAAVEKLGSGK